MNEKIENLIEIKPILVADGRLGSESFISAKRWAIENAIRLLEVSPNKDLTEDQKISAIIDSADAFTRFILDHVLSKK